VNSGITCVADRHRDAVVGERIAQIVMPLLISALLFCTLTQLKCQCVGLFPMGRVTTSLVLQTGSLQRNLQSRVERS
jgi:hypothetical protein